MDLIEFSVPGNLLLMGEYIILEEGGKGISLAIDKRAFFYFKRSNSWRFFGKKTSIEDYFLIENKNDFVYKMFNYFKNNFFKNLDEASYNVYIDTSSFFFNNGRKKGYGSSAVVAVGLSYGFFLISNKTYKLDKDKIFKFCLKAYRYAQGNKGSGYDIATSLFGGTILFEGGANPKVELFPIPNLKDFYLIQGLNPIKTISSIDKYIKRKEILKEFILKMKEIMDEIIYESRYNFISSLKKAKVIGNLIGEKIGISAHVPISLKHLEKRCDFIKALGAGNETFLIYKPDIKVFSYKNDIIDYSNIVSINLELDSIKFLGNFT